MLRIGKNGDCLTVFNLYRSNSEDRLVQTLADILTENTIPPMEPEWISVQSSPLRAWLSQRLAEILGISAGIEFFFPRELIENLMGRVLGERTPDFSRFTEDNLSFAIFALLKDLLNRPEFSGPRDYLKTEHTGLKRYKLAKKIANIFDSYTIYRPEMMLQFEQLSEREISQSQADWQAIVFRTLVHTLGSHHLARGAHDFLTTLEGTKQLRSHLPQRICLVCISHLPPLFLQLLNALGRHIDVHLLITAPSQEFFGHTWSGRPGKNPPVSNGGKDYHFDVGNPLLSRLGRLARDFQQSIEEQTDYHETDQSLYTDPVAAKPGTLLKWLQSDVLHLRNRQAGTVSGHDPLPILPNDNSLTLHSCHSPLRELEVVRENILSLFDDSNLHLTPEDVLVMAPDIHDYFPFVESVFAGEPEGAPAIPFSVCDLGPKHKSQVIAAFLRILRLPECRATLEEVFDILRIPPVREKAELSVQEVNTAYEWALAAGIRWGIDRQHREQHDQPGFQENTWQFGLQRMVTGYAIPADNLDLFAGVVPFDPIEGQEGEILGKFVGFIRRLFHFVREFQSPDTLQSWKEKLTSMVADLIAVSPSNLRDHQTLTATLDLLHALGTTSGVEESVHLKVVEDFLASKLEATATSRGFLSGGVTFSSLRPMRNVPFQVICLLGMNQEHFPRSSRPLEFDKMAEHPRLGDRSPGLDDRYLFLQAMLSAKEHLIISYVGQNPQDGSPMEPSQVVLDLLDVAQTGFYLDNSSPNAGETSATDSSLETFLVTQHPLSPFSPSYFDASANRRLFSYSRNGCLGARALLEPATPTSAFVSQILPLEEEGVQEISIEELIRFLGAPSRHFVRARLGIDLDAETVLAPNREPVEPDALEDYVLGTSLLRERLGGADWSKIFEYFQATGNLPLGQVGRAYFQNIAAQVDDLAQTIIQKSGAKSPTMRDIQTVIKGDALSARLYGRIGNIWPPGRIEFRYGKITPKSLLQLWVHHLCLHLAPNNLSSQLSLLIGRENTKPHIATLRPLDNDPEKYLADLMDIYWLGQTEPLSFFPDPSFAFAQTVYQTAPQSDIRKATLHAVQRWQNSAEPASRAVRLLHRHWDPIQQKRDQNSPAGDFAALSIRIWTPIFDHLEQT